MYKILVADDDQAVRSSLKFLLGKAGYQVFTASNPGEIIQNVREESLSLVILDMNYSFDNTGEEGLELISRIKVFCPLCPIILITAWGSVELAVKGIKAGAFDFITKPWNNQMLLNSVETALELSSKRDHIDLLTREELDSAFDFKNIIGKDDRLNNVLRHVSKIVKTHAPVLLTGETGTGKELIAEAIHRNSNRKHKPFIKVNLGGLSTMLFESEMFGHKKGAFTDANSDRVGRFELADGGTIFLDEVGELDLSCQVKLLRVLQEQMFEPLGDSLTVTVDVRVICATHRNLFNMVEKGLFREDLLYRINLIHLEIPPLRSRVKDISILAEYFLKQALARYEVTGKELSEDAHIWLRRQTWPGNVRELKNLIERTVLIADKETLQSGDFKEAIQQGEEGRTVHAPIQGPIRTLEEVEKKEIIKAIHDCDGNMSMVAKVLGISRATLYRKLDKYKVKG